MEIRFSPVSPVSVAGLYDTLPTKSRAAFLNLSRKILKKIAASQPSFLQLPPAMRILSFITLTLTSLFVLSSCQKEDAVTVANRENILILGNSNEPKGLDPHRVSGVTESKILRALFEGLIQDHPTEDFGTEGGAAQSWTSNSDKSVWTFKLREDGKWSDGIPLTSEDFQFAYHRILNPDTASPFCEMLYFLKNAKAYNTSQLGYILCGLDKNFPVSWEEIKAIDFGANDKSQNQLNAVGLDHLSNAELKKIRAEVDTFEWPAGPTLQTKQAILDRLIAYHDDGKPDLWSKANVGVEATDSHTLLLTLRGPTTFLPQLTKHFTWYPVPKHAILKYGKGEMSAYFTGWTDPGKLVSNGPFQLKSWIMNQKVEVTRNPQYWDANNVKLDGVRFLPIPNLYTEARMFKDQQLHITGGLAAEVIDEFKLKHPEQLRQEPYIGTLFYRCNTQKENGHPLTNPLVREALNLTVKRDKITQLILRGYTPASSITPPMDSYQPPKGSDYNPERARELMAEAGFPNGDGFPTLKILIASRETARTMAEAVQAGFQEDLGINVEIENKEWAAYLTAMREGEYDLAAGGWIGDYLDPLTFLELWTKGNSNNNTGWSNEQFEKLLVESGNTPDIKKRNALLFQAEQLFIKDNVIIPVAHYSRNYLIHPAVKNYSPLQLDNHPYKQITLEPTPPVAKPN